MKKNGKKELKVGGSLLVIFTLWTGLVQCVDVKPIGANNTDIGFSTLNSYFHQMTGVHMTLYTITDWLGLIPIFVCVVFGGLGLVQLIKRKSLFKVDKDLILLGIYYFFVIIGYLIFEMIPINYRPILIEGRLEASYPSSTTLLVLSVMPTLLLQVKRRSAHIVFTKIVYILIILFSLFMVIGRLVSGVHWLIDIIGALILSTGLYYLYKALVLILCD
ncbi:phosphatase PAP2 family protein [uncultured Catenibacterium sp.]|uniref:phosphatase PAP2 family protein n=1 Tax=uncultured Catenibacterium sp. TaxID=286142 RepID=UPI0025FC3C90|nr:phosphatase PAP2 family protein [uncultured Catenibacterium sp.]